MKIEILSPVHVGSGEKYTAIDFTITDGRVIFLDISRVFQELERRGEDLVKVADDVGRGRLGVEALIEDIGELKRREVPFTGVRRRREILKHIQSAENLYIPGFTIKGAIRTAILWKAVKDDHRLLEWTVEYLKNQIRKGERLDPRKLDDKLEAKVFRSSELLKNDDPKNDLLRALRVTDSNFFRKSRVYEVKFLSMRNFSVLVECIEVGDSAEVEIEIDEIILSYLGQKLDFDDMMNATREFAEEIVNAEVMRSYPERTKNEFRDVLKARGLILRIGWGIGWYSTTIGTLLRTHREFEDIRRGLKLGRGPRSKRLSRNFPVTRRVTWDDRPLGWVSVHE